MHVIFDLLVRDQLLETLLALLSSVNEASFRREVGSLIEELLDGSVLLYEEVDLLLHAEDLDLARVLSVSDYL